MPSLPSVIKTVTTVCAKNSRKILLVVGITGALGSVALAIKATPRAMEVVEDLHAEFGDKIPAKEFIRRIGPIYAPTVIMLLTTCGAIIGAHRLADKENAILASIAGTAQCTVAEYERRLSEELGENTARKIKEEVQKHRVEQKEEHIEDIRDRPAFGSSEGYQLYREPTTGAFFWATEHSLSDAITKFNHEINKEMWASLNDWLYYLDIDRVDIGDRVGWNLDHMMMVTTRPAKCLKEPYAGRSYLLLCYDSEPVFSNGYR